MAKFVKEDMYTIHYKNTKTSLTFKSYHSLNKYSFYPKVTDLNPGIQIRSSECSSFYFSKA